MRLSSFSLVYALSTRYSFLTYILQPLLLLSHKQAMTRPHPRNIRPPTPPIDEIVEDSEPEREERRRELESHRKMERKRRSQNPPVNVSRSGGMVSLDVIEISGNSPIISSTSRYLTPSYLTHIFRRRPTGSTLTASNSEPTPHTERNLERKARASHPRKDHGCQWACLRLRWCILYHGFVHNMSPPRLPVGLNPQQIKTMTCRSHPFDGYWKAGCIGHPIPVSWSTLLFITVS